MNRQEKRQLHKKSWKKYLTPSSGKHLDRKKRREIWRKYWKNNEGEV